MRKTNKQKNIYLHLCYLEKKIICDHREILKKISLFIITDIFMDPGDPEIKEEILDAAIKLENIDKLINDFDDDDEDDDEDFKYISEDDDDDSDYNYKSSTVSQNFP